LTCSVSECGRRVHARGYCGRHYQRLRQYGSLERTTAHVHGSDYLRFWKCVLLADVLGGGCWPWRGPFMQKGYGLLTLRSGGQKTTKRAHRLAYELLVGAIPRSHEIHHVCENKACVNPAHLVPVTAAEHEAITAGQRRRGRSPKGPSKPQIGERSSAMHS
jgi:hypothetical protein